MTSRDYDVDLSRLFTQQTSIPGGPASKKEREREKEVRREIFILKLAYGTFSEEIRMPLSSRD